MNSNQRYARLLEQQEQTDDFASNTRTAMSKLSNELEMIQNGFQKNVDEFVLHRLTRLRSVGRSVLMKSNANRFLGKDKDNIHAELLWLVYDFRVTKLTNDNIYISLLEYGEKVGGLIISRSYLHMGDRDMAKLVRKYLLSVKAANDRSAAKKKEGEVEDLTKQINELQEKLSKLSKA